jgi:molybdate transport system substrate-binding protein
MKPPRRLPALIAAALVSTALAACAAGAPVGGAGAASGPGGSPSSAGEARLTGTLTVFAAASLKATFTKLATEFEAANPGTKVALSFAGSSDLVTQISQGAPADVIASADTKNMAKLADAGLLDGPARNFATNVLAIAVPPANPASIASFADLARPGVRVVVCAGQVPCGAAAAAVEKSTGVTLKPVSEESSVTDVLGKVTSGEADAGLVYVTDAQGVGDKVTAVSFPEASQAVNTYPIAALKQSKAPDLAQKFIDAVTGEAGQKVLNGAGFTKP